MKKLPNKGTADDAKNEVFNLIRLAHESRNRENIMVLPSYQDLFPDETYHALSYPMVKDVRMNQQNNEVIKIEVKSRICSTS